MKAHEMRAMTREELEEHIRDLREELFNLRFRRATQHLDNPLRMREARRELARTLTVLQEMDPAAEKKAAVPEGRE